MPISSVTPVAQVARPVPESVSARSVSSALGRQLSIAGNLRTDAVPTGWEARVANWASERENELDSLSMGLTSVRVSNEREQDLRVYLAQLAQLGEKVDGVDLQRLYVANESVQQTRELLRYGRGNVVDDIKASNHKSSRMTEGGRNFNWDLGAKATPARRAAVAVQFGAGNCGEYAMVATHVHSGYLPAGQAVAHVGSKQVDHGWAEELSASGRTADDDIVLDGWGVGGAVFRAHSEFAADSSMVQSRYRYFDASGNRQFALDLKIAAPTEKYAEKYKNFTVDAGHVWLPTPVVSQGFIDKVSARQELGTKKLVRMARVNGASSTTIIAKARANKLILEAGVLRDLERLPTVARKIAYVPPATPQVTKM